MERTITITGIGTVSAVPDAAVVSGEVIGTVSDYAEAVRASAGALTSLRQSMGGAGFDTDDLRTTSFSVDTVYRSGPDGTSVLEGYRYMHGISIVTEADGETLGRLLAALTSCDGAPEFRVSFVVKDPSGPMSAARKAAVKDAESKSREIASAAGVELGDIISISYASQPAQPMPRGRVMMAMAVDATPKDVEFRDSVTIQWELL